MKQKKKKHKFTQTHANTRRDHKIPHAAVAGVINHCLHNAVNATHTAGCTVQLLRNGCRV